MELRRLRNEAAIRDGRTAKGKFIYILKQVGGEKGESRPIP